MVQECLDHTIPADERRVLERCGARTIAIRECLVQHFTLAVPDLDRVLDARQYGVERCLIASCSREL